MVCQPMPRPLPPSLEACASINLRSSITICGRNGRPYCLPRLMLETSAEAGRTRAGSATRPVTNSRLFMLPPDVDLYYTAPWTQNPVVVPDWLHESEQPRRIVGQHALSQRAVGCPFAQQIIELDGADAIVERQMRKVAAPDQLVRHLVEQRLRHRPDVGEIRFGGEAIDPGEFDKAAPRTVPDQLEEFDKTRLLRPVLGRK